MKQTLSLVLLLVLALVLVTGCGDTTDLGGEFPDDATAFAAVGDDDADLDADLGDPILFAPPFPFDDADPVDEGPGALGEEGGPIEDADAPD